MRVIIDMGGDPRDTDVLTMAPAATLGDLIHDASGQSLAADERIWVDDEEHVGGDALTDCRLMEGSVLARDPLHPTEPIKGWTAALAAGSVSNGVVAVPRSRALIVGRSPSADLTLEPLSASWSHFTVEREGDNVRVKDTNSTNGTFVNGVKVEDGGVLVEGVATILAGGVAVVLRPDLHETAAPRPGTLHNVTAAGTVPFNRPPRPGQPPALERIIPPERKEIAPASKFQVITILGPLVLAVAMVVMMGDMRYAAVSALSPLLGVGTWFEQKRRRAKDAADEQVRFQKALVTLRDDIDRSGAIERERLDQRIPDPASLSRRALIPTVQLWQRRWPCPDFLALNAGVGDVPWTPPVDTGSGRPDDAIKKVIDATVLASAPLEVDLNDAGVVGIVGDRARALALARSLLLQAAVHCGPADLTVGVFCDHGRDDEWSWATWLPHTRRLGDGSGDRWLSADRRRSVDMLRGLRETIDSHPTPCVLLVIDSDVLTEGRDAPARLLLGHGRAVRDAVRNDPVTQVSGIVIAAAEEQLPASCTVIVHANADAAGTLTRPGDLTHIDDVVLAGVDLHAARDTAVALARFDDPELVVPGAALPSLVRLPPLLGAEPLTSDDIAHMWANAKGIAGPIGMGEKGTFSLDLVRDGPHGLVGGTTGSGKSEFLRSLVAGLAAHNDPTRLNFILIDFKGGAAFKECERLPHTIGTVSNLDAQLADRAIRALEAEMDYRQRAFAAAGNGGVDNIDAYWATKPAEPMPRLLLVIDEFAMLAKDYPDVLTSLVSVGAVGRTLGVHMILATQRPAGVVNDDILANTNLRVALRVQSTDDSVNVIGVPTASAIGRTQMGRAFVKLGQDDITPVQTALITGHADSVGQRPVECRPVVFGPPPPPPPKPKPTGTGTDLDALIDTIRQAADEQHIAQPRKVWPEPLGERVDLAGFGQTPDDLGQPPIPVVGGLDANALTIGLSDDPDRQRQIAGGWDLNHGNLLLIGIPGSGTSTALASVALTAAQAWGPDELDILTLDMGPGDLAPLADLPHSIGYAGSGTTNKERQLRLLAFLRDELDRRRAEMSASHKKLIVLIDGLATLRDEYQDFRDAEALDGMYRAWADGPENGMWFAASTTRAKAIPPAIDEVTTQKWLFRLSDPYDYSSLGLKLTDIPPQVPGRCVLAETHLQTHIATPAEGLAQAAHTVAVQWGEPPAKHSVVRELPSLIPVADLGVVPQLDREPWRIPIGIQETDLQPAFLELYENEHALVAGPARSGRSTVLLAIAEVLRTAPQHVDIWAICTRRSLLADASFDAMAIGNDEAGSLLASAQLHTGPLVVLIDDAEKVDDDTDAIADLIAANQPDVHIIAAGRAEDLRSVYSGWTANIRKSHTGILLHPNPDYDGDLLSTVIPRTPPVALGQARGYLCVSGVSTFVQCLTPSDMVTGER